MINANFYKNNTIYSWYQAVASTQDQPQEDISESVQKLQTDKPMSLNVRKFNTNTKQMFICMLVTDLKLYKKIRHGVLWELKPHDLL